MEEVNVKKWTTKKASQLKSTFDTKISPSLKEEADTRDLIRKIQEVKMDKKIIMWVVIGILFLVALYFVFQTGSGSIATQNINSETASAVSSASSSAMVGGC